MLVKLLNEQIKQKDKQLKKKDKQIDELMKKTGINIDGYGNIQNNEDKSNDDLNPNNLFKIKDLSKDNKYNEKESKYSFRIF